MKVCCKVLLASVLVFLGVSLFAQAMANTASMTAYKNALNNLFSAKDYLEQLGPTDRINDQERHAIGEMENAIHEIEAAGLKNVRHEAPLIAPDLKREDRYVKALSLCQTAYSYIEKNPSTDTVRDSHIKIHIKAAVETIKAMQKERRQ